MSKFLKTAALLALIASSAAAELNLGRVATPDEIAAWDIDVRPDGQGLPEGRGTAMQGEEIFAEQCAVCHGDFGEGVDRWPVLAGGQGTLVDERPVKTIGSYWPYLSTVWDYVHRAMPFGDAQSLSNDQVYAITAYLLYSNDLVEDEEFELSHENFTDIRLPNEDGFYADDRAASPIMQAREVCMTDCKDSVEITKRAAVIDVTPEETAAEQVSVAAEPEVEVAAVTPEPVMEHDPVLVAKGAKVFKKCKACHQIGEGAKNRVGPHLNGLFGRPAGGAEGFTKYSKGMAKAGDGGLVWDEATLTEFLTKPKAMIKGTKMSFAGIRKASDMEAILAYLQASSE